LGFGIAGILIAALSNGADWLKYIVFIFCTIIFTLVYLGFAIFMSTISSKRSTAIAGGVLIFFSGMIIGIVAFGVWVATSGHGLSDLMTGDISDLPGWFWAVEHINFMDGYGMGAMLLFGTSQFFGVTMVMPDWVSAWSIFGVQLAVAVTLFLLSMFIIKKKDV
jgi:ABC-type transport system involved in multi-copper enzyme maturation permease subunit